jgi:hypothetical protein
MPNFDILFIKLLKKNYFLFVEVVKIYPNVVYGYKCNDGPVSGVRPTSATSKLKQRKWK